MRPAFLSLLLLAAAPALPAASPPAQQHWVATWGASPAPQFATVAEMREARFIFENQTLRQIAHVSIGGASVRVRLSNAYGKDTVEIGQVHIALRSGTGAGAAAKTSAIDPSSDRPVTFSGRPSVAIPPDALVLSDPVTLTIPPLADVVVSIYIPNSATAAGIHYGAQQTAYIAAGNQTAAPAFPESGGSPAATIASWVFLTGLDVLAPAHAAAVVAFGDSITDGARSTTDANRRWPDILAARLASRRTGRATAAPAIAVVDSGIGGNRILHNAVAQVRFGVNGLARFERDVLAQPGVKYVVVLEGINDIGHAGSSAPASEAVTAEDLIAGLRQMIERAHEKGLKIFGATLTPFEGTIFPGYYSPAKDAVRKAVNHWIRTSGAFDGVIDFDKAVRDPANPDRILNAYDAGDHLHPGDAGYKAMGEAVDLSLFR
jgi:lysophospholipase L1-like esterase